MAETTAFSVDTDDEYEYLPELQQLRDEEERTEKKPGFLGRVFRRPGSYAPLSIQSGDIVRETIPNEEVPKGTLYAFFFRAIHALVKIIIAKRCLPQLQWIPSFVLFLSALGYAVLFGLVAFVLFPPSLNLTIRSFGIPDHITSENWDAFQAATNGMIVGRNDTETDGSFSSKSFKDYFGFPTNHGSMRSFPTSGLQTKSSSSNPCNPYTTQNCIHPDWILDIVFRASDGVNLLSEDHLGFIHRIEEHIYNDPDYKDFCHKMPDYDICDPVSSLLTYLYPRYLNGSYENAKGDHLVPNLREVLLYLKENVTEILYYTGGQIGPNLTASLLRSQVRIGVPLPGYESYYKETDKQEHKALRFFIKLADYLEGASSKDVEVLYGGTLIFDYQVQKAIEHDYSLALGSLGSVLVLMFFLTGFSIFSTLFGVVTILTSFPLAFFVYRVIFGYETIGILNIISLFVIIGIGVDDVFVYLNTFKQSRHLKDLDTVEKRLTHTIITAGKATFFTSLTTSVAFFANAVSQIPAVQQFGVFMGFVVLFCYIQVFLVMPFYLYYYDRAFLPAENWLYSPVTRLFRFLYQHAFLPFKNWIYSSISLLRSRHGSQGYSNVLSVRMQDMVDDDVDEDSGIDSPERGNGSMDSEESSMSSGSDSNLAVAEVHEDVRTETSPIAEDDRLLEMQPVCAKDPNPIPETIPAPNPIPPGPHSIPPGPHSIPPGPNPIPKADGKLTSYLQNFMLKYIARPIMILHLLKIRNSVLRFFSSLGFVGLFIVIFVISLPLAIRLEPTDHPPQFFDPDSNIQKMLDLSGNLTDLSTFDCMACPYWYQGEGDGGIPPPHNTPSTPPPDTPNPDTPKPNTPTPDTDTPTPDTDTPTPDTDTPTPDTDTPTPDTDTPTPDTDTPTPDTDTPTPDTPTPDTPTPDTPTPDTPTPDTLTPDTPTPDTPTPDTPSPDTPKPDTSPPPSTAATTDGTGTQPSTPNPPPSGNTGSVISSKFSNNVTVYVVFGIMDVKRNYSTSHVLPTEGEGDYAVLDPAFNGNLSCTQTEDTIDLTGTFKALCRICKNITDPRNGLVLNHNAQCFPMSSSWTRLLSCLGHWDFMNSPECDGITISDDISVEAEYDYSKNRLWFLGMAFRSTTFPGASPFANYKDYLKWKDFVANELEEIKQQEETYEGAYSILKYGYQTSEYWVELNTELIAVYGAIYGILLSFVLCSMVVVIFSHNWRIVLSMFLTIFEILVTLLALFKLFGWKLGIVEAISLSILVGNSLDYCIHLTEGYLATDSRHIAFVESFKFTAGATIRVKRVLAAISFIGVSIISSAITTILAITPLLGTKIQLFKRFGEILLLDTLVAIVYTLVFCSTFLGLIGPTDSKFSRVKWLNAILTITVTFAGYLLMILALYIASQAGVDIPAPQGGYLFQ